MKAILTGVLGCCVLTAMVVGAADETAVTPKVGADSGVAQVEKKGRGMGDAGQRDANRMQFHQEMIKKFDTDGDGKLSDAEREVAKKAMLEKRVNDFFAQNDKNGDGSISKEEYAASLATHREMRMGDGKMGQRRNKADKAATPADDPKGVSTPAAK